MQHHLFKERAYINGQWVSGTETMDVVNPATEERLGTIPQLSEAHIDEAIEAAEAGFQAWSRLPAHQRAQLLRAWYQLIEDNTAILAKIMTLEEGKTLREAEGEIRYASSFIAWFSEEARRVHGYQLPGMTGEQEVQVVYEPIGIAAAITPWNFPAAMITRKAGAALAAGCSMIIKPAEQTPYSALALAALAAEAGIPGNVLQVVTGEASRIGKILTSSAKVCKLSFTGSTEVGKLLMAQSANTLKRLSLELGGNAPFIIYEDANLEQAIEGLFAAKMRNNGQTCVSPNRILIHRSLQAAIEPRLQQQLQTLKPGDGLDPASDVGPLVSQEAVDKVAWLLQDAVAKGAQILCGGKRLERTGYFFAPTLVTHVTTDMRLSQEEIFGPVYALSYFDRDEEAIALANQTPYGLVAYAYTTQLARYHRLAKELAFGMIALNTASVSYDQTPFGGIKESGFGREGSLLGIYEYLQTKVMIGNPYAHG